MKYKSGKEDLKRAVKELSLLFEISQVLDESMDMRDVVGEMLKVIAKQMGMIRCAITLLNRKTGEITIQEAYGLSDVQKQRGKYRIGEGITGKVIETGKPVIIPKVSEEPLFLDKTGARKKSKEDISFICVPIRLGNQTIGTLSADRKYSEETNLEDDVRLLSIIASMIARSVKLRQSAIEKQNRLIEENLRLHRELEDKFKPSNIIGKSAAMQDVYSLISQVCRTNATVLITGETGTGKELVASAIHYNSLRSKRPFIKVNCAALPESILESELFGHEEGAFTGAVRMRKGRFELAHKGSIFLDEIGELSPSVQVKLLRVLQEKEIERVGGTNTIKVDVRVIAATNRNLEKLVSEGKFREDLYYRLNVFPIHIPPLRERKTDILLLADYFIEKYSKLNNKNVKRISTPAIDMLMSYHWPGNVRELENCIERAVILTNDEVIHSHHLPPTLQTAESSGTVFKGKLLDTLAAIEKEMIIDALKISRGNKAKAARYLGITERLIGIRVKKYNINPAKYRTKW